MAFSVSVVRLITGAKTSEKKLFYFLIFFFIYLIAEVVLHLGLATYTFIL